MTGARVLLSAMLSATLFTLGACATSSTDRTFGVAVSDTTLAPR